MRYAIIDVNTNEWVFEDNLYSVVVTEFDRIKDDRNIVMVKVMKRSEDGD